MSDFVILTDSSADLPAGLARQIDVQVLPLAFIIAEQPYTQHLLMAYCETRAFCQFLCRFHRHIRKYGPVGTA